MTTATDAVPGDDVTGGRRAAVRTVALVGNPNSGKTTLFNALTGLRQKVGNFPGVTVEKKEGRVALPGGGAATLIDLPGLYSLTPHSPDEAIAGEVLTGRRADTPAPDLIVNVVDASNLERNLYLTCQLLDLGVPLVVVLTMGDELERGGANVDAAALEQGLGVPVRLVTASKRHGLPELLALWQEPPAPPERAWEVPPAVADELARLQSALEAQQGLPPRFAFAEAASLLVQPDDLPEHGLVPAPILELARQARERLTASEVDGATAIIEARYAWIARAAGGVVARPGPGEAPGSTRRPPYLTHETVDRVLMHPFWGYVIFAAVMLTVFQAIFAWSETPMGWIESAVGAAQAWVTAHMAEGALRDLIVEGGIAGVGNTLVFLPQILLLFFFVSLLEDTGYMARAAFLVDRLMSKVGLHGKSFIPLLSSFACAIPGIMATRTIGDRKARLLTILVAPLMSCSARLPVYTLMIGAFIPNRPLLKPGGVSLLYLPGVTLAAMYFLSMGAAFGMAWLFHRTLLRGVAPTFLMELPPYRLPGLKAVLFQMGERAWLFLARAGTVILALSVVLWALSAYPKRPGLTPAQQTEHSYAGRLGHAIEPLIAPLGFDWKMGIGIVASFAAREVFVSAMGTVYSVEEAESDAGQASLRERMRADTDPRTGRPVWTPLTAVALMVFYVLAMQCISTVAIVKRETNGWKWPLFQLGYMTLLAWVGAFVVYQGGRLLGWG